VQQFASVPKIGTAVANFAHDGTQVLWFLPLNQTLLVGMQNALIINMLFLLIIAARARQAREQRRRQAESLAVNTGRNVPIGCVLQGTRPTTTDAQCLVETPQTAAQSAGLGGGSPDHHPRRVTPPGWVGTSISPPTHDLPV
jgi:hypothetical protein